MPPGQTALAAVPVRSAGGHDASSWDRIAGLVLDAVSSVHTRRVYAKALRFFFEWHETSGRPGMSKATVQRFRAELEARRLAPSSINVYLSAVRKLAQEAADNDLLAPELAAGVAKVHGVHNASNRAGNWLTAEDANLLLALPGGSLKGTRDRAMLALLIGCGLRRAELAGLTADRIQMRDARWVLVDLAGKGRRVRTVPVPAWVKLLMDAWLTKAKVVDGFVFRPVNKGGHVGSEPLSEDTVWRVTREYGLGIGQSNLAPHDLRRTCAKLCRSSGGDLEQIQLLLGHASVQTTERYLGTRQQLAQAVNDNLPIRPPMAEDCVHATAPRKSARSEGGLSQQDIPAPREVRHGEI